MAEFKPDVDQLLQRFTIEKPNESFEVGPVTPDPTPVPAPAAKSSFDVPAKTQAQQLEEEAAKVQDIINIIKGAAPQISVPIPPEEQPFLGTAITTNDYLATLETNDDRSQRLQQHFESGVLSQTNDTANWPILMAKDLITTRDALLTARNTSQGQFLTPSVMAMVAPQGSDSWQASVVNSGLTAVNNQLIQSSGQLRFKTAQTVFTMQSSLQNSVITRLVVAALDPELQSAKAYVSELVGFLKQVQAVLNHSQVLLALEHVRTGQELLSYGESKVIQQILSVLVVKLSDVTKAVVTPLLNSMQKGLGSVKILETLGSDTDHQLVSMIGGACQAMVGQYTQQVADFLRTDRIKNSLQLAKLQSLGEKSLAAQWVRHLDQIIRLLQSVVDDHFLTQKALNKAVKAAIVSPSPPISSLLSRFLTHPELQQAQTLPLIARTIAPIQSLASNPLFSSLGNDPSALSDPTPQFGALGLPITPIS